MMASSACLPPSCAKSTTAEDLDVQLCANGPQLMDADVEAHTEAWDRNIPSDSRGDTIARRCTENALQAANSGERTRFTERQGSTAPDTALSKDCVVTHWPNGSHWAAITASFSLLFRSGTTTHPPWCWGLTGNY
ncbi:Tbingi protein [Trypanosoma cruzi]|nr:Tbingi protein [Trypanosoma cruzi]